RRHRVPARPLPAGDGGGGTPRSRRLTPVRRPAPHAARPVHGWYERPSSRRHPLHGRALGRGGQSDRTARLPRDATRLHRAAVGREPLLPATPRLLPRLSGREAASAPVLAANEEQGPEGPCPGCDAAAL